MYSLTKNSSARDLLAVELPSFAVSLIVTNTFLKLGNFAAELTAFLALWFACSATVKWVESKVKR